MTTSTTNALPTFRIGDEVYIDPASATKPQWQGTWEVVKINQRTVRLTQVKDGRPTFLTADKSLLFKGQWPEGASPRFDVLDNEWFDPGSVVTLRGKDGLFVVTGTSGNGYRLFPLGGSSRYYRGVSARQITRVTEIDGWRAQ